MKLSATRAEAVYAAIHNAITDLRISLKLPGLQDVELAQVEHAIWRDVQAALKSSKSQP